MFFNEPKNPSRLKRAVYLSAATILGIILSFIAHALIEIGYLHWAESQGRIVFLSGGCALPWVLRSPLFVLGAVGGFFLGRFWWRKIYIERVRTKNKKILFVIFGVVLLLVIVYLALGLINKNKQVVACTMDAKLCSDGSYVGRTGPNCEFAPCPGDTPEWLAIKQAIYNCEVESTGQTHSLEVSVKLKNGGTLKAIEPSIDDIFTVAEEAEEKCGKIRMATE